MKITYLGILASLLIVSCTGNSGHKTEHFDIDGVPVVRTTGDPKYEGPLFELDSDLIIGIDEGDPEWQMFAGSPRLLVAPDGRMVLVDSRRFEIFITSQDGQLMHRLGGRGSGPGEFNYIQDVLWAEVGKEFWLTDPTTSRITRISMEGELIGDINYSSIKTSYERFYYLTDNQFLAQGEVLFRQDRSHARARYALINDQLEIEKELFEIEGREQFLSSERSRAPVPFTAGDVLIPLVDGRLLHSQPNYPRLSFYSRTGDPLLHVERDWEHISVTQEEKDSIEKSWREAGVLESGRRIPYPDYKPPFGRPILDSEGRIWLRSFEPMREEGTEEEPGQIIGYDYEIFSRDGVWLGTHTQRPTIRYITGEFLYQSYSSDAGAPRIERLRITPLVPEMGSIKP